MSVQTDSPPISASLQMANDVERRLREQQLGIYFVMPRVVRRVLQNELDIASPWQPPPHRKCCVMPRDRLLWLVNRDELGVDDRAALPEQIVLIAQPEEYQLETMTRDELQRHYWRLMFHARIDFEMSIRVRRDRMPTSELRRRIDLLGQTSFDEIRSVLRSEQMLMRPEDDRNVYAEFVAVYHELRAFAPRLVPLYFPSLPAANKITDVIGADCDAAALLQETRPIDLATEIQADVDAVNEDSAPITSPATVRTAPRRSARRFAGLVRTSKRLGSNDNNVRAALYLQAAIEVAPPESVELARQLLDQEIRNLVDRLQTALQLNDEAVQAWSNICQLLLPGAQHGFWNSNARLLYDLQNVCFDYEHEIYKVDLLRWGLSLGKAPLKRPLPNQRIVLMSKHLRRAALRTPSVEIDPNGRHQLSHLLHEAADAAERIMRGRVEPSINTALSDAGLIPSSTVERVAAKKLVRELADGVVKRGFITLGNLRDAISNNQLKMPDLNDFSEFISGDPLLRADQLLAGSLDGVYQRGPLYLRWLQKTNSLAYGIPIGRILTRFVFLPFGLSFLLLMFVEEIGHLILGKPQAAHQASNQTIEKQASNEQQSVMDSPTPDSPIETAVESPILSTPSPAATHHSEVNHLVYSNSRMFLLGCLMFALIHFPHFRRQVVWVLKKVWIVVRAAMIDVPRAIVRWTLIDWFLRSFPMMLLRRFIFAPVLSAFIFWFVFPYFGFYPKMNIWWGLAIFLLSYLVLNSRIGRDTEELTREFFGRTWYRIRVHLVLGLFTFIVDGFKALMDGLERVLYAVDEWLRFRSGESNLTLGIKAVAGLIWSFIHGVIRFCVTLLIEPQLNPIKHFPVVTVSHKIVAATLFFPIRAVLERFFDSATAILITGAILTSIPGAFGFLAWELKENWKLYKANRSPLLKPIMIGDHGESLLRLLCPGFHSGTIPRLFAKRRRVAKQRQTARNEQNRLKINKEAKFAERLHHETVALRHFFERELLTLMSESRTFRDQSFTVDDIELATNRVIVTIRELSNCSNPLKLEFAEQSGWLIAGIREPGWLNDLEPEDLETFKIALSGMYKLASVDLVREQIERQLVAIAASNPRQTKIRYAYDISAQGLVIWPNGDYEREFHYPLDDELVSQPRPRSLARSAGLNPIPIDSIVFKFYELDWDEWRKFWDNERSLPAHSTARFAFKW